MAEIGTHIVRVFSRYWMLFLRGTGYTLLLSAITVLLGAVLGALLALLRRSKLKVLNVLVKVYVDIVRGTPLLLQLYLFVFMIPMLWPQITISKFNCVLLAMILNSGAYVSEIIRAGIEAVDKGQTEAARSLGLNGAQTMRKVVLPQAIRNILPALGNELVTMIKETSLASTFFIGDLMTQYKTISAATALAIEPLLVVGVIYFVLTSVLSKLVNIFQRRLNAGNE